MKKWVRYVSADTYYDKIIKSKEGYIATFLRKVASSDYRPKDNQQAEAAKEALTLAIRSHYIPLSEAISQKQMRLYHFDKKTQDFLKEVMQFKESPAKESQTYLYQQYELIKEDLEAFELQQQDGQHCDLVLSPDYPYTIFYFQKVIQEAIVGKEPLSFEQFVMDEISVYRAQLIQLKQTVATSSELTAQIEKLEEEWVVEEEWAAMEKEYAKGYAMAKEQLSIKGYSTGRQRHRELLKLIIGQQINLDSSVANNANRTTAIVKSEKGVSQGTSSLLMRLSAPQSQNTPKDYPVAKAIMPEKGVKQSSDTASNGLLNCGIVLYDIALNKEIFDASSKENLLAALSNFRKILETEPKFEKEICEKALLYTAKILHLFDRLNEAMSVLDRLLYIAEEQGSMKGRAHYAQGLILYQKGRFKDAVYSFNQAKQCPIEEKQVSEIDRCIKECSESLLQEEREDEFQPKQHF